LRKFERIKGKTMKKWIVLSAGVILQAILGGIYAWSAFVPSLVEKFDLSKGQCGSIFGLTIAVFTIAMIPAGRILQNKGPRFTAVIGAILFTAGYLSASYSEGNFTFLLLSFGVLMGSGIGFGYVVPLTTGMKWFPDNRGLVTGVAVAGFGGGAILFSSLTDYLLSNAGYNLMQVFKLNAILFGSLSVVSALFMSEPENAETKNASQKEDRLMPHIVSLDFFLIFVGMFAGTFAGLLVVGNLKPMMLSHGLSDFYATLSISLFALGNIAGRVLWGQVHDRAGSRKTILMSLGFFFVAMLLLNIKNLTWVSLLATPLIGAGFGGCFVVYASTVVDKFSVKLFPRLYPLCFLAYGLAALTGPSLGGWLADRSGSYSSAVITSLGILLAAAIIIAIFFKDAETGNDLQTATEAD
jgi:OFA family oxalate/formate antiporter-like MFS transporter